MKIESLLLILALCLTTTLIFYYSYDLAPSALIAGFLLSVFYNQKETSVWNESKKVLLYALISASAIDLLLLFLDFDEGVRLFSASFYLFFGVILVTSSIGSFIGTASRQILLKAAR